MRAGKPAAFVFLFLLAAGPALTCLPAGTSAADPPPGADWIITEDTFLMDQSFSLEWNLTVRSGAKLVMDNVSLNFTYNAYDRRTITAEKGALMVMRGCRLNDPQNSSQRCGFQVFGELKVDDSWLCNLDDASYYGGLVLRDGGSGTIHDSVINPGWRWSSFSIDCYRAVLEYDNSTSSDNYGIRGHDSRLSVTNSTFTTSYTAVYADNCSVDIDRCKFSDNYEFCLYLLDSSARVTDSDFGTRREGQFTTGTPIATRPHDLTIQDCRFEDNGISATLGDTHGYGYTTGIRISGTQDCFLFNDSFRDLNVGVDAYDIQSARLTSNFFTGHYSSQYCVQCYRFISGACLLDGNRFENCSGVYVYSGSASIEGNEFRTVGYQSYSRYGISTFNGVVDASNNIIEMDEEYRYGTGISLQPAQQGATHNVRGNRISGGNRGIEVDGSAVVDLNMISNCTVGVFTSSNSYLSLNTIKSCQIGIYSAGSGWLTARNNTLSGCNYGIRCEGSGALNLTYNHISAAYYGIEVAPGTKYANEIVIYNNVISAYVTGIYLDGAVATLSEHSLAENSISDCEAGIELRSSNIQMRANRFNNISCWGIYAVDTVTDLEAGLASFCSSAPSACRAVKLWTGSFQVFYNRHPPNKIEDWGGTQSYHLRVRDALGRTLVDSDSGTSSLQFKEYMVRADGERVDFNPHVVEAWQDGLGAVRNDVSVNITSTIGLYLKKGPDLAVVAMNMSNPSPVEGELVFFIGTVLNRHNFNPDKIEVGISQLQMVLDDQLLVSEIIHNWTSNTELPISASWVATPGWHNVTLTAMVGQAEWDVFPDNNRLTGKFYVTTMPFGRLVAGAGSCFAWTPFDLAIAAASEDPLAGYRFDFGDGRSSGWLPSPNATHTYAAPGDYTVRGWVATKRGAVYECAEPLKLRVLMHIAAAQILSSPDPAPTLRPVLFTASLDQRAGDLLKSIWDFGDGSYSYGKEMLVAEHSYAAPGAYDIVLTLELAGGGVLTLNKTIRVLNTPPEAAGRILPEKGDATTVFTFRSESSDVDGRILAVRWELGDGTCATSPHVTHSYATHGLYKVNLTVQDDAGDWSAPFEILLAVDDIPPTAIFKTDRDAIDVGSSVRFDASATTDLDDPSSALSYSWDFGDGRAGHGPVVEHTFSRAGSYSVTLTVEDGANGRTSKNMVMVVREAPLTGIDWRWPAAAVSISALVAAAILVLVRRAATRPAVPPRVVKRRLRQGG